MRDAFSTWPIPGHWIFAAARCQAASRSCARVGAFRSLRAGEERAAAGMVPGAHGEGPGRERKEHHRFRRRKVSAAGHEKRALGKRVQFPEILPPGDLRGHRLRIQRFHTGHPPVLPVPAKRAGHHRHHLHGDGAGSLGNAEREMAEIRRHDGKNGGDHQKIRSRAGRRGGGDETGHRCKN